MTKNVLTAAIALSLLFILGCSEISEPTEGLAYTLSRPNPEIITKTAEVGLHNIKVVADTYETVIENDEADNAKTHAFSAVAPDLIIKTITWLPERPSTGDTVTFTVTIKNQGNGSADSSCVAYYIDDAPLTSDSVNPIDPDDTATKTFTWTAQAGSHNIKAVADSNEEVIESDETNNVLAITLSTVAPDLIIKAITWSPENPSKDTIVFFTVAIKNQGNGRADSSHVDFYVDGSLKDSQAIQGIDAGTTVTERFTWIARAGPHNIKAVADSNEEITESDETNNALTVTLSTLVPDLIIETITWLPEEPLEGDTVTFTVTIKNQGSIKADYSRVAYYVDDTLLTSDPIISIDPDDIAEKTFTWTAEVGPHDIRVVADTYETVIESDETNNAKTVTLSAFGPDLIVQDITWSPESPSIGDTVTFTVIIENQGASAGSSCVGYYIDDVLLSSDSVEPIDSNGTAEKTFIWTAEAEPHAIKAVADSDEEVTESDETNNALTITFPGTVLSDLIVQEITWSPERPSIGDTVTFTVAIKNQGSGKAASSCVAYYIDNTLLTSDPVESIDSNGIAEKTFTWPAQAGSHDIKAIADSDEEVTESDETNNTLVVTLSTIAPDLIIQDITWSPERPSIGDIVTFTVIIKNQGSGKAASSLVYFYIDGSSRGYQDVQEIKPGATVTKTFTWTAQTGQHPIRAVADGADSITESNEFNNRTTVIFSISPPPSSTPAPGQKTQEADVHLYGPSTEVSVGQDIILNLSAANPTTNPTLTVQLILRVPSGMSVTSDEFIKDDTEQYTASYSVEPGDSRQIEVYIRANQEGSFSITGHLIYYFAGDKSTAEDQALSVPVTVVAAEAPVEEPTPTHSAEKGIWPGYWVILAVIALGGLGAVAVLRFRKRS